MSSDDDPELRDVIARCLESNGVLGKIRAQLRASTFLALEQQEDPKITFPVNSDVVQKFGSSPEGALSLSLVRELLSFLNLQFTLSVFDPESCASISYHQSSRKSLAAQCGIDLVNSEEPVLCTLVKQIIKKDILVPEEPLEDKEKLSERNNISKAINGEDYGEDFVSSSSTSTPPEVKEKEPSINNNQASVEEDLELSASDLLASQSSNTENETADRSTSNSLLGNADYVENLTNLLKP